MGSGSTGKACKLLGYDFIGIEMEQEYLDIATARIEHAKDEKEVHIPEKQKKSINKFFDL